MIHKDKITERFLRYISIDTQSNEDVTNSPSNKNEFKLAKMLVEELKSFGISDAHVDDNCYVMATLPSNLENDVPTIGFISHLDTSPDMSGANIKPNIVENYNGEDIVLNKEKNIVLTTKEFPELLNYKNQTIITTDGTTLLGADDKAGIAEIMTAIEFFILNPEFKHGTIKIAFTPDEEIGRGPDHFNVDNFGAKYAYTIDGGEIGEIEYETFNASSVKISIQGRNVHPGYAKNKMINSIKIAKEFDELLPADQRPYNTEGYEGYFHLTEIIGTVESCEMSYIIRDHDRSKFDERNDKIISVAKQLNDKYGEERVKIDIKHQYYNMREKIEPVIFIVNLAFESIKEAGIKPIAKPVRGGTDGARLSYMGLPCPNIFAGGHNFHGKFEFVPIESMLKASEVIINIIEKFAEGNPERYK